MNRVFITGLGIWSCIGKNIDEVEDSLAKGKCGLGYDPSRTKFHSILTGIVEDPEVPPFVKRYGSEQTKYMYEAVRQAIVDAEITEYLGKAGLVIGTESGIKSLVESWDKYQEVSKTSRLGSTHVFKCMASNPTAVLSHAFGIKGLSFTLSSACSSGGHAVGVAYKLIQSGMADLIICGGCEEVNSESTYAFDALGNFAKSPEEVRPFDKDRKGLAPSGGAACLVLESERHMRERERVAWAEIIGYGATSSAELATSTLESEIQCMKMAMGNFKYVDMISAHATGTLQGDQVEAEAISHVFPDKPYISATKALTGHELRMAGTSELIYSILSLRAGFIPPNPNTADESLGLNIHRKRVACFDQGYILSNSFGLGGTNSSILLLTV